YYIIVSSANTALGDATNVNFDIEITKNPDLEIAITSIAVAASSCGLEESTIGCNITNNGVLTATGFDVTYTINEELRVVETFTETINPGESGDFEFLTLANFPTVGEYDIIVSVNLIGDENTLNDEMSVTRVRTPLYNTYPFTEDFESDYGYWITGGTASSWEYGDPDSDIPGLVIYTSASGDYCWVTNIAGNTNTNETSYIESPCYDLSSLFLPTLELSVWVNFSAFGNSGDIVASIDGGLTWDIPVYTLTATTGWQTISTQMPDLVGMTEVRFRINYSGGALVANGIGIDDFTIKESLLNDVGITAVTAPVSKCGLGSEEIIIAEITNFGAQEQTDIVVDFSTDGGVTWLASPETAAVTILSGETYLYQFTATGDFSLVGEHNILVKTSHAGDEDNTNDEFSYDFINFPIYNSFPYTEDFESGNGFWVTGGTASSWEYGNPDELITELVINSAASGDNCWVTNLAGNTNTNEVSYIESPCYDLTSLFLPTLEANIWVDFSFFGNTGNIQASIDGGATYTITVYEFAATTEWQAISVQMPDLANMTDVKFRLNYSGGTLVANGIGLDDFTIKESVLNDLGVTDILFPTSSCGMLAEENVSIVVTNYGVQPQSNVPVDFSIDGGVTWLASPEIITDAIQPGGTYLFTFGTTVDMTVPGDYQFVAKTIQTGDEDETNDTFEKIIVSQNTIDANDYVESFESGPAGWFAYGTNSTMELATPAYTLINSAGDGDYSWVTNATGYNDMAELSYLESPCFDFTGFVNPKFSAMVQYETTNFLSNFSLEYSLDGATWNPVAAGSASVNWYGTGMIPSSSWSGSSAGWITVETNIPEVIGSSSVKLRFVFDNGDFAMTETEGVAIDLINIYDCDVMPNAEFSYTVDGLTVSFINESENGETYEWNFGDNEFLPTTSTEENPAFTYLAEGSYYVLLTVTNECSSAEYGT
ncbi:MAG: CARDB domain-containing protein, partial [Bacteroidales bacterium]|nr:CARDB domain-containing protein [Bacteroidales bacterium]